MKLTRRLIINVVAFVLASTAITIYGIVEFFGNPLKDPDQVTTELADSSGLRQNFSVSHNGIVVGVISGTELTDDGVLVTMTLNDDAEVPRAVQAKVVRASPVGEQRLELEPVDDGSGPLLSDGDRVPAAPDAAPPVVSEVVDEVVRLIDAVPPESLNTVIQELSIGLEGRGDDIALFIESSTALNEALLSNEEDFRRLLESAPAALDTLNASSDDLEQALSNTKVLTRVLADERDHLVSLLRNGADLAVIGRTVVVENGPNLVCLTSDLAGLNALVNQPENLSNLDRAFQLNYGFFGPITNLAPQGPGKDLGLGEPKPDQTWLRVSLLTPPRQPPASPYVPPRPIRDVRVGAACETPLGSGAAAPTQSDPDELFPGTEVQRASAEEAQVAGQSDRAAVVGSLTPSAEEGSGGHGRVVVPVLLAGMLVLAMFRKVIARRLAEFWAA